MPATLENPWQDEKPALALYAIGPFAEMAAFLHSDWFIANLWLRHQRLVLYYYDSKVGGDARADLERLAQIGYKEYPYLGGKPVRKKLDEKDPVQKKPDQEDPAKAGQAALLLAYPEGEEQLVVLTRMLQGLHKIFTESRPKVHCSLFMPSASAP